MGGGFTAMSNDASSVFYNTAALGTLENPTFEVAHYWTFPNLKVNGQDHDVVAAQGFYGILAIPFKIFGRRVTIGVAPTIMDQFLQRTLILPQETPQFLIYENRVAGTDVVYISNGIEVNDSIFIGAGVQFADTINDAAVSLKLSDISPDLSEGNAEDSSIDLSLNTPDPYLMFGGLFRFGFITEALKTLELGISYRHKSFVSISAPFSIILGSDVGINFSTTVQTFGLWYPTEYALGLHYDFEDYFAIPFDLLVDVTYQRWSEFTQPAVTSPVSINVAGADIDLRVPTAVDPNFDDTLAVRVGGEYTLHPRPKLQIDLRGGYYFQPTPVPEQDGELNFIDHDKHTWTAGFGITGIDFTEILPAPISLDAHASYTLFPREAVKKSDPTDAVGDWEAKGNIIGTGVTLTLRF